MSPAVEKQHQSMKAVSRQWQAFHKALHEGNVKTADRALGQMLESTRSLEEFKLHRNADKREQFLTQSRAFGERLAKLKDVLKTGDVQQARELEKATGDDCVRCHAVFK